MANSKVEKSNDNATFAEGGDTPMFGTGDRTKTTTNDAAGAQTAGQTSSDSKNNPKYAAGGSSKMFGFNPAVPAKAGITSAR
jgi:hypothetical protein